MKEAIRKYGFYALIGLIVAVYIVYTNIPMETQNQLEDPNPNPIIEHPTVNYIYIDIKGAVNNPGVYKFEENSRLFQAIQKAGGLLTTADENKINLSLLLQDEQMIYIPQIGEEVPNMVTEKPDDVIDAKININTAPSETLQQLPGIGPSTAQKIIDYRTSNGSFVSTEDIMNVPGIGEATYNEIKNLITY